MTTVSVPISAYLLPLHAIYFWAIGITPKSDTDLAREMASLMGINPKSLVDALWGRRKQRASTLDRIKRGFGKMSSEAFVQIMDSPDADSWRVLLGDPSVVISAQSGKAIGDYWPSAAIDQIIQTETCIEEAVRKANGLPGRSDWRFLAEDDCVGRYITTDVRERWLGGEPGAPFHDVLVDGLVFVHTVQTLTYEKKVGTPDFNDFVGKCDLDGAFGLAPMSRFGKLADAFGISELDLVQAYKRTSALTKRSTVRTVDRWLRGEAEPGSLSRLKEMQGASERFRKMSWDKQRLFDIYWQWGELWARLDGEVDRPLRSRLANAYRFHRERLSTF